MVTYRVIGQKSAACQGVALRAKPEGHSRCENRHLRYGDWKRAAAHNVEDIVEVSPHRRAKHEEQ
ncbi:MAG: hypothetical protein JRJ46_05640 [Deltaproteobacteria bacterium]|nr:hypothetical protein [Deltaproteobacteria bacterium]